MNKPSQLLHVPGYSLAALFIDHKSKNKETTSFVVPKLKPSLLQVFDNEFSVERRCSIRKINNSINAAMAKYGIPGLSIAISRNGQLLSGGFGFSDVENKVLANEHSVCRIGSISKPFSSAILAKMLESSIIDLDKPISDFGIELKNQMEHKVTTRQLVSHLAGIRHYEKSLKSKDPTSTKDSTEKKTKGYGDGRYTEFFSTVKYDNVADALKVFANDELVCPPGSEFHYTTYGYTLLSRVMEVASSKSFKTQLKLLFRDLKLHNTYLDESEPIIANRYRYYTRNDNHQLVNSPGGVNNSNKWAGGGLLSSVVDLTKFGNVMLASYLHGQGEKLPSQSTASPFLRRETVETLWNPLTRMVSDEEKSVSLAHYGMGWQVMLQLPRFDVNTSESSHKYDYVYHTGGSVGASSVLCIFPESQMCVAILCNMEGVNLTPLAVEIARIIDDDDERHHVLG